MDDAFAISRESPIRHNLLKLEFLTFSLAGRGVQVRLDFIQVASGLHDLADVLERGIGIEVLPGAPDECHGGFQEVQDNVFQYTFIGPDCKELVLALELLREVLSLSKTSLETPTLMMFSPTLKAA